MPTPTTYPTAKQTLGWAVETVQGTAVLPITFSMPVDSFTPEDKPTWLDDKAMRANMADLQGRTQGVMHTEFSFSGPCFLDALPYFLKNILGELTLTGSIPYVYTGTLLNSGTAQPNSLTLVHWQGLPATSQARTYPGACLSELTISGNAESSLITLEGKGMAYPSLDTASLQTSTFTTLPPQAAWRYSLGLGGTVVGAQNKTIRDWTVTITRELRPEFTSANTQAPYIIQRGKVGTSGSLTFTVPSDESALNYLLNNTQPQLQIKGDNGGTGATLFGLQIDSQITAFDTTKIKLDEEAVGYDATWVGVANSTNVGPSGGRGPISVAVSNQTAANPY